MIVRQSPRPAVIIHPPDSDGFVPKLKFDLLNLTALQSYEFSTTVNDATGEFSLRFFQGDEKLTDADKKIFDEIKIMDIVQMVETKIMIRRAPFDNDAWNKIEPKKINPLFVKGFDVSQNDNDVYSVWIDTKDKQYMTFIDPKGLVYHRPHDPKIQFYKTIKELENYPLLKETKGSKDIILNSFIISGSDFIDTKRAWNYEKQEFADSHILFLEHKDCIDTMFLKMLG